MAQGGPSFQVELNHRDRCYRVRCCRTGAVCFPHVYGDDPHVLGRVCFFDIPDTITDDDEKICGFSHC